MATITNDLVSHLQCGEALSLNDAVYISSVDSKIYKYSPLDPTQVYAGIAKEAGLLNAFIRVVQSGRVKNFSGLTAGQLVYASITTPGAFQLTAPGSTIKVVLGIAKSATELVVNGALGIKTGGDGTGSGGINYILSPDAESGTTGWAAYSEAQTFTVTIASPAVFTIGSTTGFYAGQPHVFTTSGTLPTGLTVGTTYYISSGFSSTTFNVSATPGGANVNTTGTQTGTHTDRPLVPLDATGGSPTTTWTTSASSPLRGTASFLLTKTAADLAGEGVSYAFTIDSADKGKVLQGYVDYAIVSGTYVDNDVQFYIYDVTNAVVIQPAPFNLKNTTLPSDRMPFEFQTAINSTSYRLVLHLSSASTSAYTLKFDNFNVGPQAKLYGSPLMDDVLFTPTGTWTTNTTYTGTLSRRGDKALISYRLSFAGAPNAVALTINMPPGLQMDASKILDTGSGLRFGSGYMRDTTNGNTYKLTGRYTSTTTFSLEVINADVTYASGINAVSTTIPKTIANGDYLVLQLEVPILGWSSSAIMSSDADTRVVALIVNTATRSITAANSGTTNAIMQYSNVVKDTHGAYSPATGQYTVPVPGIYRVSAVDYVANVAGAWGIAIFQNGVNKGLSPTVGSVAIANSTFVPVEILLDCKAGDTIDIRGQINSGSTTNTIGNNLPTQDFFCVERLAGPSQIAASESVNAVYKTAAGQSIPNGTSTIINYGTAEFDSHNAVTTGASWKFTAPMSGKYLIAASFQFAAQNYNVNTIFENVLYKNGVFISSLGYQTKETGTVTLAPTGTGSRIISLLAGEFIDMRVFQNNGGSISLSSTTQYNFISITRVGN